MDLLLLLRLLLAVQRMKDQTQALKITGVVSILGKSQN
jgi:hypothetical protein